MAEAGHGEGAGGEHAALGDVHIHRHEAQRLRRHHPLPKRLRRAARVLLRQDVDRAPRQIGSPQPAFPPPGEHRHPKLRRPRQRHCVHR